MASGRVLIESVLGELAKKVPAVATRALRKAALDVQGRAQRKAPKDTGHLRATGHTVFNGVQISQGTSEGSVVETGEAPVLPLSARAVVGFNATTPDGQHSYAIIQHEELGFHHEAGEAKYLEKAMNELAPGFLPGLANAIREGLLE